MILLVTDILQCTTRLLYVHLFSGLDCLKSDLTSKISFCHSHKICMHDHVASYTSVEPDTSEVLELERCPLIMHWSVRHGPKFIGNVWHYVHVCFVTLMPKSLGVPRLLATTDLPHIDFLSIVPRVSVSSTLWTCAPWTLRSLPWACSIAQ
jgi:hypothetical protein